MDAKPQKPLPRDTNAALKNIMGTIKCLEKIYLDEETALKSTDTKAFLSLQDKKIDAALNYQNAMSQMMERKDEIKHADKAIKDSMQEAHNHFKAISQRNLEAIERMQRCTERLGNTIRSAAIKAAQAERGHTYGQSGDISDQAKRKSVSAGLNETA